MQRAQVGQRLAARGPAHLGRARRRRERRIDEVDVERQERRAVTDPRPHPVAVRLRGQLLELVPVDGVVPEPARLLDVALSVERPAHPRLHRCRGVDQPLFDGALEHGAVEVAGAVVRLPDVGVGIQVHQRELTVHGGRRPQLGQHHRVVAAEAERHHAGAVHRLQVLLDQAQRALVVAGHRRQVAVVDHREVFGHVHPQALVVGAQQRRRAADRLRPEPRARLERHRVVDRHADDGDIHVVQRLHEGQAHEGADSREARGLRGVGGAVAHGSLSYRSWISVWKERRLS